MSNFSQQQPRSRDELEKTIVELRQIESILTVELALSARRHDYQKELELHIKKRKVQSNLLAARAELERLNQKRPHLYLVK